MELILMVSTAVILGDCWITCWFLQKIAVRAGRGGKSQKKKTQNNGWYNKFLFWNIQFVCNRCVKAVVWGKATCLKIILWWQSQDTFPLAQWPLPSELHHQQQEEQLRNSTAIPIWCWRMCDYVVLWHPKTQEDCQHRGKGVFRSDWVILNQKRERLGAFCKFPSTS